MVDGTAAVAVTNGAGASAVAALCLWIVLVESCHVCVWRPRWQRRSVAAASDSKQLDSVFLNYVGLHRSHRCVVAYMPTIY